jgi:large subunit ribosomal protein L19
MNNLTKTIFKKQTGSPFLIKLVENKFLREDVNSQIFVGDVIRLGYNIQEGEKERIQYYEGIIISKQNRGLGQSFTLRRNVQGIGVEQIFLTHSPRITSINKKQSSKIRRAKLYFLRFLTGKATQLRVKF